MEVMEQKRANRAHEPVTRNNPVNSWRARLEVPWEITEDNGSLEDFSVRCRASPHLVSRSIWLSTSVEPKEIWAERPANFTPELANTIT